MYVIYLNDNWLYNLAENIENVQSYPILLVENVENVQSNPLV